MEDKIEADWPDPWLDSAKRPLQKYKLPIQLAACSLSSQAQAHLLQEMLKFILFIREQITASVYMPDPANCSLLTDISYRPYHEISILVDNERTKRTARRASCRSSAMNRHVKVVFELRPFLDLLNRAVYHRGGSAFLFHLKSVFSWPRLPNICAPWLIADLNQRGI